MSTTVTLSNIYFNEVGSVEVVVEWNGTPHSVTYQSVEQMVADSADILSTPAEAVRFLLNYVLAMGVAPADLPTKIGKTLKYEIKPAASTTISFV